MKIAIFPNISKPSYADAVEKLVKAIEGRAELIADDGIASGLDGVEASSDVFNEAEVAIVIGGDGSILRATPECAKHDLPILGINFGHIGFMSEIEMGEIKEAIDRLLVGDYREERRMMMDVSLVKADGLRSHRVALNDAVVTKNVNAKLISMDLFCNDEKVSGYVADGLIIATPTGSTGYNISAGGPVINPVMELFSATSICPHTLSARPMIMPAEHASIKLNDKVEFNSALLLVDGEVCGEIKQGDVVNITKSEYKATLIKMGDISFYDVLMNKLS